MRKYDFRPAARAELLEAAKYYQRESPRAAKDFRAEITRAIRFILLHPEGSPIGHREDVRCKLLRRFPYSLFYRVKAESIQIIAVAHQSRRPGYWTSRL